MRSDDFARNELIIIGGAYKSGTSALCSATEAMGYENPASVTNPYEQGHGRAVPLYATRECSVARSWNRKLVAGTTTEAERIQRQLLFYLMEMTESLGTRIVIKDPYMRLVASHWVCAASLLGIRQIRILITVRAAQLVRQSQERTPFMRWQMRKYPAIFERLSAPLDRESYDRLVQLGAQVQFVPYAQLLSEHTTKRDPITR